MTCPSCGTANEPGEKFCGACGAPLVASRPVADAGARKVVTIVFADLIGSTALHERLDAESARALMDRYYRALHAVVETHGGSVVKLLGDGVMAAFGLPRVAEDDAIRAVRAAVAMQQAFRALVREQSAAVGTIGLRVAVNTGEVVVNPAHDDVVGDPINVAARLQDAAQDGDVVIGESTRRLVGALVTLAALGRVALRGRAETVAAYRVVSLERPGGASAVAFVGREEELARLTAVYDAARAAPAARLAVVLGSPGVGKSRLLDEFTRRLAGATVLVAHCEAAGGATFAPVAKALRAVLGVGTGTGGYDLRAAIDAAVPGSDADRGRIAAGIGALLAGTPASPEETFFVIRRLLAGLAAAQPVVLVLDDLQWAEPLLLDLLEHLVQWTTGVPLLLLAAARPDLREARSALVAPGRLASDVVMLGGLDAAAATRLAANVLGVDALPAAVAGRVLATSEGNPLFLGELVRMLVDDGTLKREGDRWTAGIDLAAVDMPPTIHALLASRIERLRAEDRLVLERAAIVGRQFSRSAVAHLLPRETHGDLDARMEALRRSELIEPDAGWFLGEPALRFHHGLIRDAAYRRVLKGTRAELHGRVADWIEGRVEGAVEHDETIGWHLEQAHRHLGELGPIDDNGRTLGDRAARYLAAAGRRALGRDDLPLAASLLGRALERLDPADPARADLALDWCEALLSAGDVAPAANALDELGRFTGGSTRLRAWHTCYVGQLAVLTDPQTLRATVDAVAAAAVELAAAGDGAGEAKAHAVHAGALARLGKVGACEAALDRALAAARRAHDRRRANTVLANAPLAALWGPSPVTRASGRCLDVVRVLRITQGAPAVEAVALRCQAVLEALRGRTEAARRMIASSRRMVEELGITQELLEIDVFAGLIEMLEGDAVTAERTLRGAYEGLRDYGLAIDAARAAAFLGRALLAQGRAAEAEALSHDSEALAGDDLQAAITWRGVRAEALAMRGEHSAAVDFARAAVDIAAATDALLHHANARLALTRALRAAGRRDEADVEEARAIELWDAKGATLLADRARRGAVLIHHVSPPRAREERARTTPRRVRANASTAHAASLSAAIEARDADALTALIADDGEVVHHPTRSVYDGREARRIHRAVLEEPDGAIVFEPLATLGNSLALCRQWISASGAAGEKFDIGAYEIEVFTLLEVDEQGRRRRTEVFAVDRLGDAVVRLYERHAELLPDGPQRARAAATARSVATLVGPPGGFSRDTPFAPDSEFVDHRRLGFGAARGADRLLRGHRALFAVADDVEYRLDDVLGVRPDLILFNGTMSGTARSGGGSFESSHYTLAIFGVDGLVARSEWFDDGDAQALARFDELAGETLPPPLAAASSRVAAPHQRHVRPNAATSNIARFEAAIAARDLDATAAHLADGTEVTDYTSGLTYDRQGSITFWRALMRARDGTMRQEPLATLGDSLALSRQWVSASGVASETFDVGAYEGENLVLVEVGVGGRRRGTEIFAADHLGDAIVRLYERYANLLPDGPARARAAATARSVATMVASGPSSADSYRSALAPEIEFVDKRALGLPSGPGAEEYVDRLRTLFEVADNVAMCVDDVLALRADALMVRWTNFGTARAGGGAFERHFLMLFVFGRDGLLTRNELFDADRGDAALARLDELTGETPLPRLAAAPFRAPEQHERRVRPNAATANVARIDAAIAARDGDAIATIFADEMETIDHTTGATFGREGSLTGWRGILRARDGWCRHEPLATLGDSLALCRQWLGGSGVAGKAFDVGAYEIEAIVLIEVDAHGRRRRTEIFAADRLGDAIVRLYELYERYAELLPDGPARARAAATARSVAAMVGPVDPDRLATGYAPAIEAVDHRVLGTWSARGAAAALQHQRSLLEVADDVVVREDDILGLSSDALLVRRTHLGTDRAGGGAYERVFLMLWVFGTDGLVARIEYFDADRDAEGLARFDELTGETPPRRLAPLPTAKKRGRRVRPNAATANADRLDAVVAARDVDALPTLFADDVEGVYHPTGTDYDRQGSLAMWRSLMSNLSQDFTYGQEPLATLGDSLALNRFSWSASGFSGRRFDVGSYAREQIVLIEVDPQGRRRRTEAFATDRLGDAVARLYERYADLLPDGPARTRAASTARSVAAVLSRLREPERYATALAPAVEFVDHQPIGLPSGRGIEPFLRGLRTLIELTDDTALRLDDILGLRTDAVLALQTNFGTDRASGGAYERHFLALWVFGADGLLTHLEWFVADREDEALARFEELAPEPPALPAAERRRVRPNAATANAGRMEAIIAARDVDGLDSLLADDMEVLDHTAGSEWGREGVLFSFRSLLRAEDPRWSSEPLATLGDALALCRWSWSASRSGSRHFDVGAFEGEFLALFEVDVRGRRRRTEIFAAARLSEAVARLYERYAELLPDGPERARAAATARSVGTIVGPLELDRYGTAFAPNIEFVDHRSVGLGSVHGADALLRAIGALLELGDDIANRIDDVLVVHSDAFLTRWTNFGTDRTGGGTYERPFLMLWVFGPDGLATRGEQFDVDREAEAIARFDELTREVPALQFAAEPSRVLEKPRRRVRPNAATANAARLEDTIAARDVDGLDSLLADDLETLDHNAGSEWGREGVLFSLRSVLRAEDPRLRIEPLATLGDALALCRWSWSASGLTTRDFDVGPYESESLNLFEVDVQGRRRRNEIFAVARLGDAVVRLYERYAELLPDGPERVRAAATARSIAAILAFDVHTRPFADDMEFVDHRLLGLPSARGAEAALRRNRTMFELADDLTIRPDDVLGSQSDVILWRATLSGTDRASGGAFEMAGLHLRVFGADGLQTRLEMFDRDREDEALARFDELTGEIPALRFPTGPSRVAEKPGRRVRPNAATANAARVDAAFAAREVDGFLGVFADELRPDPLRIPPNAASRACDRLLEAGDARDWDGVRALCAPALVFEDRRRGIRTTGDREMYVASSQYVFSRGRTRIVRTALATAGDRLVLEHHLWTAAGGASPFEIETLSLLEVDAEGHIVAIITFDSDDRRGASVEMFERWARSDAARWMPPKTIEFVRALNARDLDRVRAVLPDDFTFHDHRRLGAGRLVGVDTYVAWLAALFEQSPDAMIEHLYFVATGPQGFVSVGRTFGTNAEGGEFESVFVQLGTNDGDRPVAGELYELEDLDMALARFEALRPPHARPG